MYRNFTQTVTFRSEHPTELVALAREWDEYQADQDIEGYIGVRLLADRDDPGRYMMVADFGVIDPDVAAAQEAFMHNELDQTEAFAARFRAFTTGGEEEWHHYDEMYSTQSA
jgi:hypothetical protein